MLDRTTPTLTLTSSHHNHHNNNHAQPNTHLRTIDPAHAADLRRRRRRDIAETLAARAQHLEPHERQLVLAVYADGRSALELAPLTNQPPRALRRRIHRIVKRITSHEYTFVLRNQATFSPTMKRVAVACFIHGHSLRNAAQHLKLTLHTVRKNRDAIHALARTSTPQGNQHT